MTDEKKPEDLQSKIDELEARLAEEEKIRQGVLEDPDFKVLLEAKGKGEKVKVVTGEEPKETSPEKKPSMKDKFGLKPDEVDVTTLDNEGLLKVITDAVEDYEIFEDAVSKTSRVVDDKFNTVLTSQQKLQQAIIAQAKETGSVQMLKQYPDFEEYATEAWKYVELKGLNLHEAYLLAKSKRQQQNNELSSEQPNTPPSRSFDFSRQRGETSLEPDQNKRRSFATGRRFRDSLGRAFDRAYGKKKL